MLLRFATISCKSYAIIVLMCSLEFRGVSTEKAMVCRTESGSFVFKKKKLEAIGGSEWSFYSEAKSFTGSFWLPWPHKLSQWYTVYFLMLASTFLFIDVNKICFSCGFLSIDTIL